MAVAVVMPHDSFSTAPSPLPKKYIYIIYNNLKPLQTTSNLPSNIFSTLPPPKKQHSPPRHESNSTYLSRNICNCIIPQKIPLAPKNNYIYK